MASALLCIERAGPVLITAIGSLSARGPLYICTTYGVAINPLAVATIQRLPQRTIELIRPMPGTVSPRFAIWTPSGPPRTTVPPRTSRTVQPSIVVGPVSGAGSRGPLGAIEPVAVISACSADNGVASDAAARGLADTLAPTAAIWVRPDGVREPSVDVVFRTPSIFPPNLVSAIRCGVSV